MRNKFVRVILFVLIFAISFSVVSKIFVAPADYRNYQWIRGFYAEEENTLDAIYIGSSNCYAFWNPVIAWEEYGIAVYPFASQAQPLFAAEYLIKEARKTQEDAVFIVNINTLNDGVMTEAYLHYLLDYMPFSLNKLALTNHLANLVGYTFAERMEFYVPMLRYHSRWNSLTRNDFNYEIDGLKGASYYETYLYKSTDLTQTYKRSDKKSELSENILYSVNHLLDYCDEENVEVIFVTVPQMRKTVEQVEDYNAINDLIEARGYNVVSLINNPEGIGLNLDQDFYNLFHTNVHGSLKFTEYISNYLIDKYGFENKKDDEVYASWNKAVKKYLPKLSKAVVDVELEISKRVYDLAIPQNLSADSSNGVTLVWDSVEGADGYTVFRKDGENGDWLRVVTVNQTGYVDSNVTKDTTYIYTVVPYRYIDDEAYYGNFDYNGVKVNS